MKKNKYKVCEIKNTISNTRVIVDDNFSQLLKRDLTCLLNEYFDFSDDIFVLIDKCNGNYFLEVRVKIQNIKQMQKLNF